MRFTTSLATNSGHQGRWMVSRRYPPAFRAAFRRRAEVVVTARAEAAAAEIPEPPCTDALPSRSDRKDRTQEPPRDGETVRPRVKVPLGRESETGDPACTQVMIGIPRVQGDFMAPVAA